MSTNDSAMEAALLKIAKDLLQASDDLAATDPSASAKFAHEAYEIGRDLGIVRNHVDDDEDLAGVLNPSAYDGKGLTRDRSDHATVDVAADHTSYDRPRSDDDMDVDLSRILDRQKAMLPNTTELAPVRKPSRNGRALTFESAPSKRPGWFGWMRPREWRHAG